MPPASQANPTPTDNQPGVRPPKKWVLIVAVCVVAAILIAAGLYFVRSDNQSTADPAQITITPDGFSPATVRVEKGQLITWANQDSAQHAITVDQLDTGEDDSETLQNGDVFSYSFSESGTYNYHDQLNGESFKGVIIVE